MEALDRDEEAYRTGFRLVRSLWQLEGTLVKTYLALTRWRRSKDETDRLERRQKANNKNKDQNQNTKTNNNDNDDNNDNLELLRKLQDIETERSANEYEDCGYEQASVSKDIGELLSSGYGCGCGCDEAMVDYVHKNYCHCTVCQYYFSKKDLGILGLIRVRRGRPRGAGATQEHGEEHQHQHQHQHQCQCQCQREEEEPTSHRDRNAFLEAMDRASDQQRTSHHHSVVCHDPNELWVDYLCKTRSIIALAQYMDEMDPFFRDRDGDGNSNPNSTVTATAVRK
eukprot:jgi/Psemu1/283506/fgenesh1_pg.28_\